MRLRNKPWVEEFLVNHQECLINDQEHSINPKQIFTNDDQPFCLEIGSGKGKFLANQAKLHPDRNYLGLEKEKTVVGVAIKRILTDTKGVWPINLRFGNQLAERLPVLLEPNSVDFLYLNFSDPWPKTKHAKKRLTYRKFLEIYWSILKPGGYLEFKTDNDQLFAFSLEEIEAFGKFKVINQTTDLYQEPELLIDNIATEYETKFHEVGKNINKIILQKAR